MQFEPMGIALLIILTLGSFAYTFWRSRRQTVALQDLDRMAAQLNEVTLRVVELELDRAGYRLWTAQLRGQIFELGYTPVPPPTWLVVTGANAASSAPPESLLVQVYHRISDHFNIEEISDLAFRCGVDGESFSGDTRRARAQSLVEFAARHNKLDCLVGEARRQRPSVDWPAISGGDVSYKDKE